MDITKANFEASLPEIEASIVDCDFIAFDCEMTGLGDSNLNPKNYLGTYEEHYQLTRDRINQFQLIQLGLTTFKRINDDKFTSKVYNFYVYPQDSGFLKEKRNFTCQSSALTFLMKNSFDFNKLFTQGLSYLPLDFESSIINKFHYDSTQKIPLCSASDQEFVKYSVDSVREFLKSTEPKLVMSCRNGYFRKLFYQTMADNGFEKEINVDICFRTSAIIVTRAPKNDDLEKDLGLTRVIKMLIKHQKPVVGHNCFLDLLFIYKTFIGELSHSYFLFKAQINKHFPTIFDTKFISYHPTVKTFLERTTLEDLEKRLPLEPFLKIDFTSNITDNNKFHDAGYDSWITGKAFVRLVRYICVAEVQPTISDFLAWNNHILRLLENKLLIRLYRAEYLNLVEDQQRLSRKDVFHMKITADVRANHLHKMFEEFGGIQRVLWINDNEVFIILKDESKCKDIIKKFILEKSLPADLGIQLYDDHERSCKKPKRNLENSDPLSAAKASVRRVKSKLQSKMPSKVKSKL